MPRDQQLVKTPAQLYDEWQPLGPHLLVTGRGIAIPEEFQPIHDSVNNKDPISGGLQRGDNMHEEVLAVHVESECEVRHTSQRFLKRACTPVAPACFWAHPRTWESL